MAIGPRLKQVVKPKDGLAEQRKLVGRAHPPIPAPDPQDVNVVSAKVLGVPPPRCFIGSDPDAPVLATASNDPVVRD